MLTGILVPLFGWCDWLPSWFLPFGVSPLHRTSSSYAMSMYALRVMLAQLAALVVFTEVLVDYSREVLALLA